MSNIETPIDHALIDDDAVQEFGEALARRLAQSGLPGNDTGPAEDTQPAQVEDEAASPAAASTDSTGDAGDGEGAVTPIDPPAITSPDADGAKDISEGAASQSAGSAEGMEGGDATSSASPPSTFHVGDRDYSPSDIERLQKLNDWASGLDPRLAQAMAAVESGQAAAIPVAEYAQFQAWKTAQGNQRTPQDDLLDGLDDQQLSYVRQLEQQVTAAQNRGPDPTLVAHHQQQLKADLDQRTITFVDTAKSWGDERGLTEQQVSELTNFAVNHGVFASLAETEREYHPINGTLLRDADMASVTTKALNFALASDPGLYTRVAQGQQQAVARAQADSLADTAVSQKKARSASLAAAPSQATVTAPTDVRNLNRDELKSSMSAFIAQAEGLPQHD